MKTFSPKKQDIVRAWYHIDADGKILGKIATKAAVLLRGKHKTSFVPHLDCGDFVVVTNAEKIVLTGNKLTQKTYHAHSGHIGHLKSKTAQDLIGEGNAAHILIEAIKGMIPPNKLRDDIMKKLKIYQGAEHPHSAQQAKTIEIK